MKGGSATITAPYAVSMRNANFTVKGGSAELNGSGAAVEIIGNGKMTLGENVTMKYGENKDGASVYEGEKDKAYDALREIDDPVYKPAAKYVSLAYVEPHTHTVGENTITFIEWTDALAAVVDLTRDLDEEIRRLCAIKREIAEVIDGVEDRRYRRLLELRYRSYHTWEQIAAEMNYDPRWVYQLHREALEAAQESREKIGAAKTRGDAGA